LLPIFDFRNKTTVMAALQMTGNELISLGFTPSRIIGIIQEIAQQNFQEADRKLVEQQLISVLNEPEGFLADQIWQSVAIQLVEKPETVLTLKEPVGFATYGKEYIEAGAMQQMEIAVRLPVAVAGALMPDAHQGYGLPIGGVLATRNAVIPYGVGVDIGCRMALSIFEIPGTDYEDNKAKYKRELIAHTLFGAGNGFRGKAITDHAIFSDPAFTEIDLLKQLKDRAYMQLGSSGGGNHFVEFGTLQVWEEDAQLGVSPGNYLALLSHSGSRGFGATIANHYTKLAKETCKLPKEAANLAYFDLDSEAGREYWMAMNLAGDYASACHEVIHAKMAKAIDAKVLARVENHHNFAWKENWNGEEVVVHRKGATPAAEGVLGIIPGSMAAPGFLVIGKGNQEALYSASHGAGRQMSRTVANQSFNRSSINAQLKELGVTLIGGGPDEAPGAYKDINKVMAAQEDLVTVLAEFQPKLVRMADDGSKED
jgi:tRNA-splicing ligase RtcB